MDSKSEAEKVGQLPTKKWNLMKLYVTKISLRIEVSIRGCSECKPGYEEVEFSNAR